MCIARAHVYMEPRGIVAVNEYCREAASPPPYNIVSYRAVYGEVDGVLITLRHMRYFQNFDLIVSGETC